MTPFPSEGFCCSLLFFVRCHPPLRAIHRHYLQGWVPKYRTLNTNQLPLLFHLLM